MFVNFFDISGPAMQLLVPIKKTVYNFFKRKKPFCWNWKMFKTSPKNGQYVIIVVCWDELSLTVRQHSTANFLRTNIENGDSCYLIGKVDEGKHKLYWCTEVEIYGQLSQLLAIFEMPCPTALRRSTFSPMRQVWQERVQWPFS